MRKWTREDIARARGVGVGAVRRAVRTGRLNMGELRSVAEWIVEGRYGRQRTENRMGKNMRRMGRNMQRKTGEYEDSG